MPLRQGIAGYPASFTNGRERSRPLLQALHFDPMSTAPSPYESAARIEAIQAYYQKGGKTSDIAKEFSVSEGYVSRVCNKGGFRRRKVRADAGKVRAKA